MSLRMFLGINLQFSSCLRNASGSEELLISTNEMAREPVYLNVYDMVSSFSKQHNLNETIIVPHLHNNYVYG